MIHNESFLSAIFGEDLPYVHVTDFVEDPSNIPPDRHLIAWRGDWYSRYKFNPEPSNQYFTISIFEPDEKGTARRRKALFLRTRCIVLDDVVEKLSMDAVNLMPPPSWVMVTSTGSEQWGYILDEPCHDRGKVENLLDGLVANGLAPAGKDPGMKGVTRYVRLPDGVNTKQAKLVDDRPYDCQITTWEPDRRTSMAQLAAPFHVDLDKPRKEARIDGAGDIPDHPLLQIPDILTVKAVRSEGRFEVECPWIDDHTGGADDGAAIFTNKDGTIGFKCHHGSCENRNQGDLVRWLDDQQAGFSMSMKQWQLALIAKQMGAPPTAPPVTAPAGSAINNPPPSTPSVSDTINGMISSLITMNPSSDEARAHAATVLKVIDGESAIDQNQWHKMMCDAMRWSKKDLSTILKELKVEWYGGRNEDPSFCSSFVYVHQQGKFYDRKTNVFYSPANFQDAFMDKDAEARINALQNGLVPKVIKLDFAPKMPLIFEREGVLYGNTYETPTHRPGVPGDVSRWLDHWDQMGWAEHRDHMLKWMAYTMRHPEKKINHMLLLGGAEGTGKDYLLHPLIEYMGDYCAVISGDELIGSFHDHLVNCKYLHINEAELFDHREAMAVSAKIKPLAAAPPNTLRVNPKGLTPFKISNIVNLTMTTNSPTPLRLDGASRRIYAMWTHLIVRDDGGEGDMLPIWSQYWDDRWSWMNDQGGQDACIWYLLNEVDISDFKPGTAPPMTTFLREITDASKSPVVLTLETFIRRRISAFHSDLLTVSDMVEAIKASAFTHSDSIIAEMAWMTPIKISKALKTMSSVRPMRAYKSKAEARVWVLRCPERYEKMGSAELYDTYKKQLKQAKEHLPLKVVK